ncbi:lysylphosphatidylglycerol synthase domain-containing protein [Streptomyces sp. TRM68367]|uniref:lysylphosphatidylglycerol synthase domain-containing protein n=1 Tax=Streptomyces sp. TRM68367 TaxID=2758415 RepID=UPI0021D30440
MSAQTVGAEARPRTVRATVRAGTRKRRATTRPRVPGTPNPHAPGTPPARAPGPSATEDPSTQPRVSDRGAPHLSAPADSNTPYPPAQSTPATPPCRARRLFSRLGDRKLRTHIGTVAGVVILAVLVWRMGTGVLRDGLRRIDAVTLLAAVGIGIVTTVFSAWRWALVARGLRIRLPLGPAVADYYRALFLNAALPGGVLGDVHRAVRHGQSTGDMGRGVKAVVFERAAGQVALVAIGAVVLLTMPSPVLTEVRGAIPLVALATLGALAVVVAVRMNRAPARRGRDLRARFGEAREGLLSRRNWPGILVSSVVVLAGHITMFVVAARVAGATASVAVLLPLAVLALLAMGLPLNVGGWGPREGVTVWAFGAAGLGASSGLAVAVVYGVLSLVASLPGVLVLAARWCTGLRAGSRTVAPGPKRHHAPDGHYPRSSPAAAVPSADVSTEKYAPKESARLASSSFPFSTEALEGRPMTPESV